MGSKENSTVHVHTKNVTKEIKDWIDSDPIVQLLISKNLRSFDLDWWRKAAIFGFFGFSLGTALTILCGTIMKTHVGGAVAVGSILLVFTIVIGAFTNYLKGKSFKWRAFLWISISLYFLIILTSVVGIVYGNFTVEDQSTFVMTLLMVISFCLFFIPLLINYLDQRSTSKTLESIKREIDNLKDYIDDEIRSDHRHYYENVENRLKQINEKKQVSREMMKMLQETVKLEMLAISNNKNLIDIHKRNLETSIEMIENLQQKDTLNSDIIMIGDLNILGTTKGTKLLIETINNTDKKFKIYFSGVKEHDYKKKEVVRSKNFEKFLKNLKEHGKDHKDIIINNINPVAKEEGSFPKFGMIVLNKGEKRIAYSYVSKVTITEDEGTFEDEVWENHPFVLKLDDDDDDWIGNYLRILKTDRNDAFVKIGSTLKTPIKFIKELWN